MRQLLGNHTATAEVLRVAGPQRIRIRARSRPCSPAPVAATKGGELQATVFLLCLPAALRWVTSEPHLGQHSGRVEIGQQTHLPTLCGLSFPRLLSFARRSEPRRFRSTGAPEGGHSPPDGAQPETP